MNRRYWYCRIRELQNKIFDISDGCGKYTKAPFNLFIGAPIVIGSSFIAVKLDKNQLFEREYDGVIDYHLDCDNFNEEF